MNIFIEPLTNPVEKEHVEFVESKGVGHPDTICDSVCQVCADALASYYKKHFRTVLHYNIDKALLVAGTSAPGFRKGKLTKPIDIIIAGRVTDKVGVRKLPVRKIIKDTAARYLKQFRLARFNIIIDVKSAAANLATISESKKPIANDTSFGASHYPFSATEKLVLDTITYISSAAFRRRFPAAGQDTKVMGIRIKDSTELTIAIAFIGKHVKDMSDYIKKKEAIAEHLMKRFNTTVNINTLDNITGNADDIYLTVSGLSAEMGDDGQVGRGNRFNELITPNRPMSMEAVAGKNARHPGRSYQVAAYHIAKDLVKAGLKSAEVKIVTNIGAPLEEPKAVSLRIQGKISKPAVERIVKRNIRKAITS
jgi:S-adenosylmethionine synthetase